MAASMGWGAMGAGAWGASTAPPPIDEDDEPPRPAAPAAPAFGATNSFKPSPLNTSLSSNAYPAAGASPVIPSPAGSTAREAELRKREAEVAERERQVSRREKELGVTKKKNWPICMPVWYHNISEEIPEGSRRVVREAYACYWGLVLMLTYQVFCATVMLGYGEDNRIPSWFLSIIFWISGVPLAIFFWYKRIYHAARDESSLGYIAFFLFFFCHFAFCVFCAIGLQINAAQWCFSGFLAGFDVLDRHTFAGIIYIVGGGAWSLLAAYSLWVLKDAWFFFRGQGGVQQVQQKAAQEAALAAFQHNMNASQRV